MCVKRTLTRNGFTHYVVVPSRSTQTATSPPAPSPQSRNRRGALLGLCAVPARGANLLLATDPDCDRCGIAVRHAGDYRLLTGNEVGVLLFDYICRQRVEQGTMPKDPIVVKTIVTTEMIALSLRTTACRCATCSPALNSSASRSAYLEQQASRTAISSALRRAMDIFRRICARQGRRRRLAFDL